MFLMDMSDVERDLLRLHQFRKLHYEVAGSLAQLKLPHRSFGGLRKGALRMTDWKVRLIGQLEPVLTQTDPRPAISAYHDMPYAIFRYPPEDEFAVRQETALLRTRLDQAGKRVTSISSVGVHVRSSRSRGAWHRCPCRSREDGRAGLNDRDDPPGLKRVPAP